MPSPDIDFKAIRLHRGLQSDAFEELCCQLAADEAKSLGARFVRKGRGADGGVEAFAVLPTGREVGWQVKYYWNIDAALASLSGSLATALDKHPAMDRFIACIPFDPADGRRAKTTGALAKWDAWRDAEVAKAAAAHRTVEIELWPAQELKDRLVANAKAAGRIAFWFDETLLTNAWFKEKHAKAVKSLGARYTPSTNVKLPIRHAILALTRDRAFIDELKQLAADISDARSRVPNYAVSEAEDARQAVDAAISTMQAVLDEEPDNLPQAELVVRLADAESATALWRRSDHRARDRSQSSADISRLHSRVADARERLASRRWSLINARQLLVTGEGGRGKSHLLADACQHQVDADAPALLVLSHLLKDEDPWAQIVAGLDLPRHVRVEEFLGALDAAAQASGVRALVVIDGINERGGQAIWSVRLAGFLHDVEAYPWISVVLSCRSTYVDATIPTEFDETVIPRLDHTGFSTSDAARYLDMRGVTTLDAPWPLAEFETPLFLKTLCDGLALTGESTLPRGSQGVSTIFGLYAQAVAGTVQRDMALNPKLKHVPRLITALAAEIAQTGDAAIPYVRADEIATTILTHDGRSERDLLFQLIASGLLSTDLDDDGEVVRFTFERFGDFSVAEGLIAGCDNADDIRIKLSDDSALARTLSSNRGYIGGVLEALAVLAPERFGIELLDLPVPRKIHWEASRAFSESLMIREATAFTDRTWALVRQYGGETEEWDTRIRLASEPDAAQNAEALHARLKALPMPERDALWSVHLAQSGRAAGQLIDWALRHRAGALGEPRALLVAIALTWFLSTSHRGLRDRATKGLVAILADRTSLVVPLLDRFLDLDDGYVIERLLCAVYGAALQGRWPRDAAADVVRALDQEVFVRRQPPVNCLSREHGRLLIQWAIVHGVLPADYDNGPSRGPFNTPWPIEHVPDAVIDGFTRTYPNGHVGRDAIVASCVEDGDFARYVLDRAVDAWSPARRGVGPRPTREMLNDAWQQDFDAKATPECQADYARLTQALEEDYEESPWREGPKATVAKAAFKAAVGSDMFERWREEAENWRRSGMYQRPAPRDHAEFNLAWARRWVCLRAHQLGWSQALHGEFDDSLHNNRMSHSVERIGKKYQWLALYELRARMADNLEPIGRDAGAKPDELRAIDPSLLAGARFEEADEEFATRTDQGPAPLESPAWIRSIALPLVTLDEALVWRDDVEDVPDGLEGVELTVEGRPWLILKGFDNWRGGPEDLNRQLSRWLTCVIVRRQNLADFLKLVEGCVGR
ncbi:MAG: AAA family ATPase [Hyphomicrobiales bacterium]|nr:MAG: AAA family ATPase [Hyphomicrobiales bacterium]